MGDDFQGCLLIDGSLKAILYNDSLPEVGRQNFTVGHELGHIEGVFGKVGSFWKNRGDVVFQQA